MLQKLPQMLQNECFCYILNNFGRFLAIRTAKKYELLSEKEGKDPSFSYVVFHAKVHEWS